MAAKGVAKLLVAHAKQTTLPQGLEPNSEMPTLSRVFLSVEVVWMLGESLN